MSDRVVARANNPLERFNREMNTAFATPHPNMVTFVTTIEELSRRHVLLVEVSEAIVLHVVLSRAISCLLL